MSIVSAKQYEGHFARCISGLCLCENRAYWLLFLISCTASSVEYAFAWFAGSNSAMTDAVHAFVHGIWYGSAILIERNVRLRLLTDKEKDRIYGRFGLFSFILLLFSLGFIGYEAFLRIIEPEPIKSGLMFWGVCVGIAATVAQIMILGKINRAHHLHGWLHFDTWQDLYISFGVLAIAIAISLDSRFYLIDAPVALFLIYFILRNGFRFFVAHTREHL